MELTDARFTVPKKAGWPRWFVADAKANKGGNARWLLVFTRNGMEEPWEAAYLTLVAPGKVPEFKTDRDGQQRHARELADVSVPPASLSKGYTTYLQDGGKSFAEGTHTSAWRAARAKRSARPGLATQYIDEPLTNGDYAPLALRTKDGGALVFFTTRHFEKQTAARGASVPTPNKDVLALTEGEIKQSLTMEFVSNQVALNPADGPVSVLGRVQGLTSAKGE
ncbi:Lipoprotein OS=Streptomyces tendae OX=1932 GN=GUR47_11085 PE=4 SV=1 [Streptomyces tendae]